MSGLPQVIDTHAHLDAKELYDELPAVLQRAEQAGVSRIVTIGCDWRSSLLAVHIAERNSGRVYAAVGVHPHDAHTLDQTLLERLCELAAAPQVVAWGEVGLDYYRDLSPREQQQRAFIAQIDAAKQLHLPLIIHDRDAHQPTVEILRRERGGMNGGILHCFSGSWEMARDCLNLGFMISFAGPLTFANAVQPKKVAAQTPDDMLLVETDCPYLSPEPHRGHTNEPARVVHTLAKLAEIRGVSYEKMAEITTANARRLFGIND
ncbi:MAG: TatD family hydrolase [Bacillota bacterium]|nr:TatD family hydrolase [Bacillota bacterium]